MRRLGLVLVLVACGGGADNGQQNPDAPASTDGGANDAAPGCGVGISFDPMMPFAFPGSRVRATANVSNAPGVLAYTWQVRRNGIAVPHSPAAPDVSAIEFPTEIADPYDVTVQISGTTETCPVSPFTVNVGVPGANTTQVRVRVYPPATVAAPPSERFALVMGGANASLGQVYIDPGVVATGSTGAQAYLRFVPVSARDLHVEGFSETSGAFSVRVINQAHDVLVVPLVPGLAPRLFTNWLVGAGLPLDAGTAISGTVKQGATNISGAKVQLVIGGVPTSLTTTDGNGNFTVRASQTTGTSTIEVTPPAATGLPRLVAASATGFGSSIAIDYATGIAPRDVGGAVVRRGGVAQPNAKVTLVGSIASAGTIGGVAATGEVRASATANGSGVLPSLRAPDELLFAVVSPAANDFTMSSVDLRTASPATIDAPPMTNVATELRSSTGATLGGAIFEAIPKGAFAMAGAGKVRVVADASGNVTTALAPGVTYDLSLYDPQGTNDARLAAPRAVTDVTAASVAASYALPKAIRLSGIVTLQGNTQPIPNAAVQILCAVGAACTGTARSLPLAESASSSAGNFAVAVGDPGTM